MIDINFLGTGGAFDYEYGNSAAIISLNQQKILLDCGHTVYTQLRKKNLIPSLDAILITHLHDDHVGSLSGTVLHHKHLLAKPRKAKIWYPTSDFGDQLYHFLAFSLIKPENYVDFQQLDFVKGVGAIETSNLHVEGMRSFAYYFEDEDDLLVYSGDLGNPHIVFDFLKQKNSQKRVRVFHEVSWAEESGVHVSYRDLMPYLDEFEIYGYHNNPSQAPADNRVPLVFDSSEYLVTGMR